MLTRTHTHAYSTWVICKNEQNSPILWTLIRRPSKLQKTWALAAALASGGRVSDCVLCLVKTKARLLTALTDYLELMAHR
jgi:hypothetical protein